jgi:mRNA interferase RelE/StbE
MKYRIDLAPEAREQFHALSAYDRSKIRHAIDEHLGKHPTQESKGRIKRLRELKKPQYRLRVDDLRVFYDVDGEDVAVLAIVAKVHAEEWLKAEGVRS